MGGDDQQQAAVAMEHHRRAAPPCVIVHDGQPAATMEEQDLRSPRVLAGLAWPA
jgi:hypothetical protein